MSQFDQITTPQEMTVLVALFDLSNFARFSQANSAQTTFELLSAYFEFAGDIVENTGGKIVKFLGDAGLIVYSEDKVNQGVLAMKDLKETGDAWLADRGTPCDNRIKLHFGPVLAGPLGTRTEKRFDIIGETVNTLVILKAEKFAMTPQVFRKLDPDTRKHFKKHTPPITYIPVEQPHRD